MKLLEGAARIAGLALGAVAAASAAQRLALWDAGVAQYAADGAPAFLYPLITAAQAAVALGAPWRRTRATAAALAGIVPTLFIARRALTGDLRPEDAIAALVILLAFMTLGLTLAAERRLAKGVQAQ